MTQSNIRLPKIIGNGEATVSEMLPETGISQGSRDTTRPAIARPGANAGPDSRSRLLEMVSQWHTAGCAVHPAKPDGSKMPRAWRGGGPDGKYGWKRFSTGELDRLPLADVMRECRQAVDGVGIFCGRASGNLEMVELEGRSADLLAVLERLAVERGLSELWQRFEAGCSDTSPSGGIHWYLRVGDGPALGNTKLAERPGSTPGQTDVLAETRGQGGWVVVAGSFGRTHGSGRPYVMRTGSPATIPTFSAAERDSLYGLFRSLDEMPAVEPQPLRPMVRRERPAGEILPGDDYNQRATWEEILSGWSRGQTVGDHQHWIRPGKTHGTSATTTADVLYVFSSSAGLPTETGLSKFAAFAHLLHAGDFRAAAAALYDLGYGTRHEKKPSQALAVRVELRDEVAELVPIDQYRRDLAQAVAVAVLEDRPGVKLLRGDPGCGKTTAVGRSVARYPRGVVSVPSHELAAEVVDILRANGADAAAYPKLDGETCGNYETASRARASGLSVAASVCPTCPLLKECRESGYLAGLRLAEKAAHKVVTHSRLQRSAARLTKDAHYLVLEEDPTTALAPTSTASRRELKRIGELADLLADAESRCLILEGFEPQANAVEILPEFEAWAPEAGDCHVDVTNEGTAGERFTNNLQTHKDGDKSPPPDATRDYPRGFFGAVCRIADTLAAELGRALLEQREPGVVEVRIPAVRDVPKNPDRLIWLGLESIDRIDPDGTAGISAEAMRLVVAAATGRVRKLYVQTELDARPGYAGKRTAVVVGVWRTQLPDTIPVFVNDGTIEAANLERLCGQSVEDLTPPGAAPLLHKSVQYPVDILPSTSTAKVAGILAGIVRAHPAQERVGVILHQRHYRELLESDDSPLPNDVRSRIAWSTYFGSGADRGTNTLHQTCDLGVVVGTFRPPPSEIRRTLVRWGDVAAASGSPTWGRIDRSGLDAAGLELAYSGRGYAELAWARAADAVTRSAMRQTVGRGRSICPEGVPVVAVTSEATGLPVAPAESLPVADLRLDLVLGAIAGAVESVKIGNLEPAEGAEYPDKNPIYIHRENVRILPDMAVGLEQIEKRLSGVCLRTARRWIAEAVDAGLVVRTGSARATRYSLASSLGHVAPAPAVERIEAPRPLPAPAPAVVVRLTPATPPVVVVEQPRAPMSFARLAPPPVVEERPPAPDWLRVAVSPERHPDELLCLRFFMAGPYASSLGLDRAWASDVTPGLVLKLHNAASTEAKRRGQPPPPVDIVAGHTSAWFAVAAAG